LSGDTSEDFSGGAINLQQRYALKPPERGKPPLPNSRIPDTLRPEFQFRDRDWKSGNTDS
jgi:hypothetical protein